MLIRSYNDELVEYPDDLVAMLLAAPSPGARGDDPDLSIQELNCLIHGMLGSLYNPARTLAQNIETVREYCTLMGSPTASNLEKARAQVKFYNENLTLAEIGYSDSETIGAVFPFQNNGRVTGDENVIDQVLKPAGNVAAPGIANGKAASG